MLVFTTPRGHALAHCVIRYLLKLLPEYRHLRNKIGTLFRQTPTPTCAAPIQAAPEVLPDEFLEVPKVAESRPPDYASYGPSETGPQEPKADIQAMLTRRQLRGELGKKSRDDVIDRGEKAAAALHMEESPTPE